MAEFEIPVTTLNGQRATITLCDDDTLTQVVEKASNAFGIDTIDAVRVSLCPDAAAEIGGTTEGKRYKVEAFGNADDTSPSTDSVTVGQCGLTAAYAGITHGFVTGTLRSGTPLLLVQAARIARQ